jgi:hypothetical protein
MATVLPTVIPTNCSEEESRSPLCADVCRAKDGIPRAFCAATCTPGAAPPAGHVCIRRAVQVILQRRQGVPIRSLGARAESSVLRAGASGTGCSLAVYLAPGAQRSSFDELRTIFACRWDQHPNLLNERYAITDLTSLAAQWGQCYNERGLLSNASWRGVNWSISHLSIAGSSYGVTDED